MNPRPTAAAAATAALAAGLLAAPGGTAAAPAAGAACSVRSTATVTPLVELYTSEGCSSCPPADRWAAGALAGGAVVAAFHVHYWDHLGWRDRFASREHTERQARERAVNGAPYSYTPQVVIGGRDRPDWFRLGVPLGASKTPAQVTIELRRDDRTGFAANVVPRDGAPKRLAGWWAVVEDGHASAVQAGENRGETLRHAAVVREWRAIAAWNAEAGRALELAFAPASPAVAAHPRRVVLAVVDAGSGAPLQAVQLGC